MGKAKRNVVVELTETEKFYIDKHSALPVEELMTVVNASKEVVEAYVKKVNTELGTVGAAMARFKGRGDTKGIVTMTEAAAERADDFDKIRKSGGNGANIHKIK